LNAAKQDYDAFYHFAWDGTYGATRNDLELQIKNVVYSLDSVELAKERVQQRVLSGGHGIPERDIERRYSESLTNLKQVLPICDHVELFDNTESFRRVAIFESGACIERTEKIPPWCKDFF
jgi:predicted ABC-type ATPase